VCFAFKTPWVKNGRTLGTGRDRAGAAEEQRDHPITTSCTATFQDLSAVGTPSPQIWQKGPLLHRFSSAAIVRHRAESSDSRDPRARVRGMLAAASGRNSGRNRGSGQARLDRFVQMGSLQLIRDEASWSTGFRSRADLTTRLTSVPLFLLPFAARVPVW
jgi:hypothetical protein